SMLLRQYLIGEPGDELVAIPDSCLAETQELADLSAVIFDCATRPLVAWIHICSYVDLVGQVDDDNTGYVVLLCWKALFERDWFEQDREAKSRCAARVGDQFKFVRAELQMLCNLAARL